jgi:hypothetical protein
MYYYNYLSPTALYRIITIIWLYFYRIESFDNIFEFKPLTNNEQL